MASTWQSDLTARLASAARITANAAAHVSRAVAQEVVHGVVGAECLLDYNLEGQVASSGAWSIFAARAKKASLPHPLVSAWVLEKRALTATEPGRWGARRTEELLEQCRQEVQQLTRLRHPSVLRVVSPLEETRTMLVFITEPVFSSLEDVLRGDGLPAALAAERRQLRLSELEIKHGLLQIAEAMHFLHHAGLAHQAVCPQHVLLTHSAWKIAGFTHARQVADYNGGGEAQRFSYSNAMPSPLAAALQPPLAYTAPELAAARSSAAARVPTAADVFSLAAVAYELVTRRQLLPVGHNLGEYESKVQALALADMAGVPHALEGVLRQMLAKAPDARPPAASFAGCSYFASDRHLRALQFLETMVQRDSLQRAAFLRDLPTMLNQWDSRVLKTKVLPPLLQELRTQELQAAVLPLVLGIMGHQTSQEFVDVTLPALQPLLDSASGDSLLLLCQHARLLATAAPKSVSAELLPRLLVRAMQHGDARAQEEGLKQMAAVVDALDYEELKRRVLPAAHELCLSTTSAAVRVAAFQSLAASASRTGRPEAEAMLAVAAQVVAVDKSAPTAMCVLGLGEALARQWGAKLAAERVLPALTPLLVMPALSAAQFATALKTIKEVLAEVERSRAGHRADAHANGGSTRTGEGNGLAPPEGSSADAAVDWMAATSLGPSGAAARAAAAPMGAPQSALAAAPMAAARAPLDLSALSLKATTSASSKRAAGLTSNNNSWIGPDTAFVSAALGAVPVPTSAGQVPRPPGMRPPPMRAAAVDPFADLQLRPAAPPPPAPAAPSTADPFDSLLHLHGAPPRSGTTSHAAPSLI